MAGEGVEVRAERLNVNLQVGGGLRPVHHHYRAHAHRRLDNACDGIDRAQGVRDVRHGDDARLGTEPLLEFLKNQLASVVDGRDR